MKRSVFGRIVGKTMQRHAALTVLLVAAVLGTIVLSVLPPLVLGQLIDRLTAGEALALQMALLYGALLLFSYLFESAKETLIAAFGQKITHSVRSEMCQKLSRLPASYFTTQQPGTVVSRFVGDVDTVEALFSSGIISMFVDLCQMFGIIGVVFYKSRGLGVLLLLAAPLFYRFTRQVQKRMLQAQLENRTAVGNANNYIPETARNIRMIHALHKEHFMEQQYSESVRTCYRAVEKNIFYDALYSPVILVSSAVIVAVMMVLAATGGTMQQFFGMTVGTAVAIISYVGKVFEPLENIGMEIQSVQSAVAGIHRITSFLQEDERQPADDTITAKALRTGDGPAVTFSNVRFSYDAAQPILQEVSFAVERQERVALVGRTGAGKSTIFKLILGLYEPQKGEIKVLGTQAARIPDAEKRRVFGYVEQQFRSVPGTVFDQIAVFDQSLSAVDVEAAAEHVGLREIIEALPEGFGTAYAESLFSQGQRQLLAVARAIVAQPAILLLDEIAANLDAETERQLFEVLNRTAQQRTVLSITHQQNRHMGSLGRLLKID